MFKFLSRPGKLDVMMRAEIFAMTYRSVKLEVKTINNQRDKK